MKIRYFDNAATTKVKEQVLIEMFPYFMESYGNPSSMYSLGRRNKRAIEDARHKVANLIGCNQHEIYFTSGGSESDNMAVKGFAYANKNKGNHIITSKIEHHAVLETCENLEKQGFEVTYLNVDKDGKVDLEQLVNSITDRTILISIMFANNEIGTIQPIEEISKIAKSRNITFHTDAVQAVGNIEINVKKLDIDMLSLSSHKIYGPKGIGALYVREGIHLDKFINGGHQEKNLRAGTENVSGMIGLGEACQIANKELKNHINHLQELRDYYIGKLKEKVEDIKINGSLSNRLPGNANVSFKDIDASTMLIKLDELGICASAGSACNTGATEPSHVLTAIGLEPSYSNGALRITFGDDNTLEDVDYLINCIMDIKMNMES
ncbi:MAG: cysteine desulfurase NifS [Clostridia bacterium]|nr:cysteine desulfurase NifS [Clostridia bacterium]